MAPVVKFPSRERTQDRVADKVAKIEAGWKEILDEELPIEEVRKLIERIKVTQVELLELLKEY